MRNLIKKILFPFLSFWYKRKNSKTSYYSNHGIRLKILPEVFHPGVFLSTNIFIEFLSTIDLENKSLLELGAGSGMISFYCSQNGASVTASEINRNAIQGLNENAINNNLQIEVVKSDLLYNLDINHFEIVVINPPYYPKTPKNDGEHAFYCGERFEYFEKLFSQLNECWVRKSDIFMILSEDCDLITIKSTAEKNKINLETVLETTKRSERNYIFKLKRNE